MFCHTRAMSESQSESSPGTQPEGDTVGVGYKVEFRVQWLPAQPAPVAMVNQFLIQGSPTGDNALDGFIVTLGSYVPPAVSKDMTAEQIEAAAANLVPILPLGTYFFTATQASQLHLRLGEALEAWKANADA